MDQSPRPAGPIDGPPHWEPLVSFLRWAAVLVLGSSAAFLMVLFFVAPEQLRTVRGGGPVVLSLLAIATGALLSRGKTTGAAVVLGAGTWAYATGMALLLGGSNSIIIVAYPAIIAFAGWMLGPRVAIAVAALTAAVCFGFFQAELRGLLPPRPPTSPALVWVVQTAVFALTALLVGFIVRSYGNRLREVGELGSQLAVHAAELEAREIDLKRAQAVAQMGSWVYDLRADVMFLSDETCRIFGLPAGTTGNRDAYLGRTHREDRSAVESAWQAAIKGGEPFDQEHRILVAKDIRWVRQIAQLEFGADGTALRSIGITQDVTERKRTEEALRESEARYRSLFANCSASMLLIDPADGRIVDANAAACAYYGWDLAALRARRIGDINTLSRDEVQAEMERARNLSKRHFEFRHRLASGEVREVEVFSGPIEMDGRDLLLSVVHDITGRRRAEAERVRLEAQLRESQKMEALGTLAGGVAHDFNNIVAAIIGNVELARQDVGPGHAALESLEEIGKAGRRAKELVQQILAFGRRQVLKRDVISLAAAVEESARLLRATLPAGVSLSVQCAPDAPAVLADVIQVEQVLLNLCTNAWQAMQGQARPAAIQISLASHRVAGASAGPERRVHGASSVLPPGRYACLTVRDTGPGMDRETMERIFEPFFTTKPVGEGTGLGLAVVYGIVQEHGASIDVQSVPGEGTTFRVYFPAVEAPLPAVAAPGLDGAAERGQGRHILYVDDDEAIVFLMTRLLDRQDYRVSGYTDPRQALAAVAADPQAFDLVVTDYNMPGLSGLEVARALRDIRADLPVALVSGYITDELRDQAPAAGVNEVIYKPTTVDELCAAIARLATAQREKDDSR